MPELRKDPVVKRWIIIATERARRPQDFKLAEEIKQAAVCPFCPGSEHMTPPEITSFRHHSTASNKEGWWVRVVPNRFPALAIEGNLDKTGVGIYDMMNGIGAHEVIIETPDHNATLDLLSEKEIQEIVWVYRDRSLDLAKDSRLKYILIFKNFGRTAGASLDHPHSQLIATPIVPRTVEDEVIGSLEYFERKERCIFCDIVREELSSSEERVVYENEHFLLFVPFAPRFPFEVWIFPKAHNHSFANIREPETLSLANALREIMIRYAQVLHHPPYNYIIHTSPCNVTKNLFNEFYHWHIEIYPRLTIPAGFEWGSGFYINPTSPEVAAKYLRRAI